MMCLPKQGIITAQLSQITRKVKQNNGKEYVIIMIIRPMERKDVYTQVLEYNFPKERQSTIGLQVLNRLDKGARNL